MEYGSDKRDYGRRYASYCSECQRARQAEARAWSYGDGRPGSLHRMADQYRPKGAETKTADLMARRPRTTKEKEFD